MPPVAREPSAYFYNLIQQPGEIFTDILTSVNEAVEQRVDLGQLEARANQPSSNLNNIVSM